MSAAWLNGKYADAADLSISVLDRGFLFADAIYEVVGVVDGQPFELARHLSRFRKSAEALRLDPAVCDRFAGVVERLAPQIPTPDGGVYLQISRGASDRRSLSWTAPMEPTCFAMAVQCDYSALPPAHLTVHPDIRWGRRDIKSVGLTASVLVQASLGPYDDWLWVNADGSINEASSANIFAAKDGVVLTPPLTQQLLPGCTRHLTIDALRSLGVTVKETEIFADDVAQFDEMWLTAALKGVRPVASVDATLLDKAPGPITELLTTALSSKRRPSRQGDASLQ